MNAITTVRGFPTVIAAVLCVGVASGFAILPAVADSVDVPQVTVRFDDLNISSPQGVVVLYRRIQAAAEVVCSPYDQSGLLFKMHRRKCIDEAIVGAIAKVNNSALTAVYSAKNRKGRRERLVSVAKQQPLALDGDQPGTLGTLPKDQ